MITDRLRRITEVKKRITVTIDEATFKALHLGSKNVSGYINDLLQEKLIGTFKEQLTVKLTRDVGTQLLQDEVFITELAERVKPKEQPNWGA